MTILPRRPAATRSLRCLTALRCLKFRVCALEEMPANGALTALMSVEFDRCRLRRTHDHLVPLAPSLRRLTLHPAWI